MRQKSTASTHQPAPLFTQEGFEALLERVSSPYRPRDMEDWDAIQRVRDLAIEFGLMDDTAEVDTGTITGYPFCPVAGCNRPQEPGFNFCVAHLDEEGLGEDLLGEDLTPPITDLTLKGLTFASTGLALTMRQHHEEARAAGVACPWGCPVCFQEEHQK